MPKPSTTPLIINSLITLTISRLKKNGLLDREGTTEADISWTNSLTKEETGGINIRILTNSDNPHIRLNYFAGKTDYDYSIPLVSKRYNIGWGKKWFFVCPETNKNCLKLYLLGESFVGRQAVQEAGGIYQSELVLKGLRSMTKNHHRVKKLVKTILEGNRKKFHRQFKGKPTKAQLKIDRARERLSRMGLTDFSSIRDYLG